MYLILKIQQKISFYEDLHLTQKSIHLPCNSLDGFQENEWQSSEARMLTRVNNILTCDSKLEKFLSLRNHSWSAQGCRVTKAMQKPKPALRNAIITHSSWYQLCILFSCNACKYHICKYPCISTAILVTLEEHRTRNKMAVK